MKKKTPSDDKLRDEVNEAIAETVPLLVLVALTAVGSQYGLTAQQVRKRIARAKKPKKGKSNASSHRNQ